MLVCCDCTGQISLTWACHPMVSSTTRLRERCSMPLESCSTLENAASPTWSHPNAYIYTYSVSIHKLSSICFTLWLELATLSLWLKWSKDDTCDPIQMDLSIDSTNVVGSWSAHSLEHWRARVGWLLFSWSHFSSSSTIAHGVHDEVWFGSTLFMWI